MTIIIPNREKVKNSIDGYFTGEHLSIPITSILDGIEQEMVRQRVNPIFPLGPTPAEFVFARDKIARKLDFMEIELISKTANALVFRAYASFYGVSHPAGRTNLTKKFSKWINQKMFDGSMNALYSWLQDNDSEFYQLKNAYSIIALRVLERYGIPIDLYVTEQLKRTN